MNSDIFNFLVTAFFEGSKFIFALHNLLHTHNFLFITSKMDKKITKISKEQLERNQRLGKLRSVDWKKSKSERHCEVFVIDETHFAVVSYTAGFQNTKINGTNKAFFKNENFREISTFSNLFF